MPILRSYNANLPAVIESLRDVTDENLPAYAINVHGLKGMSGNIGASDVVKRAARMETAAKSGDLPGVLAENGELLEYARALGEAISAWLSERDAGLEKPRLDVPDPTLLTNLKISCSRFDMNEADSIIDELCKYAYNDDSDNELIAWLREKVDLSDFGAVEDRIGKIAGS
jgi:HPt (histidine-containing phosphotransfer) domain-containing protein